MMRIEQRLKKLADENPNYSLLWAQWEFDKKLLSRALNTISRDFPHYSLHDASHSSTIITQIEKVISSNIENLSATDCWLLLESCYWHDAGMIITSEEKKGLLASASFLNYLKDLSETNHELSTHAQLILQSKEENDIVKALNISNSLTFVIADYFRSIHAERSGLNVNDPTRINVFSPRTSLIPQRLFNFVAQITQCHGRNRESILGLAKYNDGMDAEDYAHPRYVAALLRVGDLLDIDDGRFCPTLLHNIGDVPQSSLDHQEKHASIRHLLINSEVIEIRAECEGYGAYHAQQSWFNYIQDEFDYQKRIWNEIVPDSNYRALPTIGLLSCEIKGYIAIDGKVPKLTLDSQRVYSYITGAQIYSERYPFVREIIQNSIDATYYKVWEDLIFDNNEYENNGNEIREIFNDKLIGYSIDVSLHEQDLDDVTLNSFKVRDYGTGMNLKDIKKILVVGSESTDSRKKLNQTMPDWAKPSGYFGIGLQSVFKLCSKVVIKTRMVENPCYEITVINDSSSKFYNIAIREIDDVRFKGTEITAIFTEKKSDAFSNVDMSYKILRQGFDPLADTEVSLFRKYLMNTLSDDFDCSNVVVRFEDKAFFNDVSKKKFNSGKDNNINITDYDMGVDISVAIDIESDSYSSIDYKYKGVEFDLPKPIMGLYGEINIFKYDAGYWLTIDRKKGRTDREPELYLLKKEIIEKHSDYLRKNTVDKNQADFLIYAYTGNSVSDNWRDFEIKNIKVSDYLEGRSELLSIMDRYPYRNNTNLVSIDSLQMNLLAEISRRQKVSIDVDFSSSTRNKKMNKNVGQIYNFKFRNDKKSNFKANYGLIKNELSLDRMYAWGRQSIPCYSDDYLDVSISKDMLPNGIYSSSSLNQWVSSHLFSPKLSPKEDKIDVEKELDVLYMYYKKLSLLKVDEDEFKRKYLEVWRDLDFI
ncbi:MULTISPECIES: ATP-binding protein [Pectobacterium]|uniref:HD domain-containing protein n=1 Tax=Pectobacterium TaxID=122277 RepID=UPI0018DA5924|nr:MULTISPECIES: ATP-binding protein [Pectobacterium]QPI43107.1 ATP-binding protein [Pectobacterium aroidearum]